MWWDAFDTVVGPEHLHVAGPTVAIAETVWRGTHVGPFVGVAPSGHTIEVPVIFVVELRDWLMAGERLYWDRATLLDQITSQHEEAPCIRS